MKQEITWIKNDGREVPMGIPIIVIYHGLKNIIGTSVGSFHSAFAKWGETMPLIYDPIHEIFPEPAEIAFLQLFPIGKLKGVMSLPARNVIAWTELPVIPEFARIDPSWKYCRPYFDGKKCRFPAAMLKEDYPESP